MHFRAPILILLVIIIHLTWNQVNYVGRGDYLYNYGGFVDY